ncbi:RDD family protein [uncultured Bdellovibrio sp.]|uniref:RDD family protein n=1 Tax=Bdellovibrio sp. HCB-162 TaxID=3394234 RepID=UPI0026015AED|nr:RDD family protein [uncultured Bdellovibrio sp.]
MDNIYVPSTYRRLAAQAVDSLIRVAFYLPFAKALIALIFTEEEVLISLGHLLLMFLIPAVYEFIFLVLMQATPGKWLMGLKVVPFSNPTQKLHWGQCILRPLTERLSLFFSWAIYAAAFFRYDRTHVADWVAETRVVQFVPRRKRAGLRWFLGSLLIIFYIYDGLHSAKNLIHVIDWQNRQVDLRALVDSDSLSGVMEDYDDL